MKNEEWRIEPRSSTQQAQLFHFSSPRHSVKNGTLIGILAAHTAENDLRTFSIVLLKGNYFLLLWTMRSIDRPVSGRVQPWLILLTPQIMCLILFWPLLNVSFTSLQEHKTSTLFDFFVLFPQVQGAYGVIQGCQNSMRHIICGVARKVHSFTTLCCTLWVTFYWVLRPTC